MLNHIPRALLRHSSRSTSRLSSPLLSACHGDSHSNGTMYAPSRSIFVLQIDDMLQEQPQPPIHHFSGQWHPSSPSACQGRRSLASSSTEPELGASLEAVNMQSLQNAIQSHFPLTDDHQVSAWRWSAHPCYSHVACLLPFLPCLSCIIQYLWLPCRRKQCWQLM